MKKIFSVLILVLCISFASNAQTARALAWSGYGNALDTVTNTGTKYAGVTISNPAFGFNFVLKVTKISGTVGGTISWQGSNNGTDYATISTTTPSDTTANYQYNVVGRPPYKYYRASWTGTGTMSASVSGTYVVLQ